VRGQSGQALPLVLVVMVVLFALAGAITLGTSELLRQQGGSRTASTDDLAVQSATADAVAQVAGNANPRTSSCPVSPATIARTNPLPAITPPVPPTPLTINFPNVITNVQSPAYCSRLEQVAGTLTANAYLRLPLWTGSCLDVPLPASGKQTWVFFDGRWSSGGYAYVDGDNAHNPCSLTLPAVSKSACTTTPKGDDCIRCGLTVAAPKPVTQVALNCDLSGTAPLYLHVYNTTHVSPARAFFVQQDPAGGTLYLVAAKTGLNPPTDYEEAILYVGSGGGPNQLAYEAPLP